MKSNDKNTVLPNFVVIGAPKSGTTSLFYYLKQHPDIYLPVKKELHYFSYSEIANHSKGPGDSITVGSLCKSQDDYYNHYNNVKNQTAIGDVSPSYLYYADVVAPKIKEKLSGNTKIIAILRNPIEKAYSQYMHMIRDQREFLPFYDAIMAEKEREKKNWGDIWLYSQSSLYAVKIKKYYEVFESSNIKVIFFDDFVNDPKRVLKEVFNFLNVDTNFECNTQKVYNRTGKPKFKLVSMFFSQDSWIKTIFKKIIPERFRIPIRLAILNYNTGKKDEIDLESKKYLMELFNDDIKEIEKIFSKNTGWLE